MFMVNFMIYFNYFQYLKGKIIQLKKYKKNIYFWVITSIEDIILYKLFNIYFY